MGQIPKPPHGTAEWLLIRKQDDEGNRRISASNAAAVHGEHRYMTGAELAAELLDPNPPEPKQSNAAMERGNALEPALLAWASEQHNTLITTPEVMFTHSRMIATLDGVSATGEIYEAKTTNSTWTGELPGTWYWQGVQQATCADTNGVWWVILDGRLELHLFWQNVTEIEKATHARKVDEFLAAIDLGMLPAETTPVYSDVARAHPNVDVPSVELNPEISDLIAAYKDAKVGADAAAKAADQLKAKIAEHLGDAEAGNIDGETVVTWKPQTRTTVDTKRLFAEHPELKDQYQTVSTFRVLRFKGDKS
jgi:predicted phage-related endonuclease